MSTKNRMSTELFGRETNFEYSETWIGYALFGMRLVMGWVLLQGGLTKLVTYLDADPANNWTAAGYLANAVPAGNPFAGAFAAMAGNPVIDMLNMWGLTLTGLALLLGAFVRFSAFWGAVMMLFYWASSLEGGLFAGLPLAHGWVVNDHIVYAVLLFGLGAFGAGRIFGVDAYLEDLEFVQGNRWLRYLMG
jgi:thiosulfate dehydrogenase [quinone] large subunit